VSRRRPPSARVAGEGADAALFPPSFLRLLAAVPSLVRRVKLGAAAGAHAARGTGGPILFRSHREYRPGDDLRRVDWSVLARHDRVVVREFEAERDVRTEIWVDGSASTEAFGGRAAVARATALACAVALSGGGRLRLGVLRDGVPHERLSADDPSALRAVLGVLSAERPAGRAGLVDAFPRLAARIPSRSRWILVSDLLSRADPGALHRFVGRGLFGALVHLRVPEVTAPLPGGFFEARDAETGAVRTVRFTPEVAARVTARATEHAERWQRHARQVGLAYVPFAPTTDPEALLRRLALDAP